MRLDPSRKRTMRRRGIALAGLILTLATPPLLAGPGPRPPRGPQDAEDARETIQVLMIVSMKKALGLSREQESEVLPKVERVLEERARYARIRRDTLKDLQLKLAAESVPEKEYRAVVVRLDGLERDHRDLEIRLREEIDKGLSARQQAQMRVFVPRFRKQMQMTIDEARRLHSLSMAPPAAARPQAVEDSDLGDEEF